MAAKTYKPLGQLAPASITLSTLYICPINTSAVGVLYVCNRTGDQTSFRIAVVLNTDTIANKCYIAYDTPIDGYAVMSFKIALGSQDKIQVYADSGNLTFNFLGCEKS